MKIFWYNGALVAESETPDERAALSLLYNSAGRTTITEINRRCREESARAFKEKTHFGLADSKVLIVEALPGDLLNDEAVGGPQQSLEHIE